MFFNGVEKSKHQLFVVVGTTSALKIAAVQAVFKDAEVLGVKTNSGVPEQPLEEEIEKGARHRLWFVKDWFPEADIYIGIENGIFYENGNYVDKAIVIIENSNGQEQVACSSGLIVPEESFFKAKTQGFDKTTVGQVMFEDGLVNKKDDPHADPGDKKSRSFFLTETIAQALQQLNAALVKPSI